MPPTPAADWQQEFGIEGRKPPLFFSNTMEIDTAGSSAPQSHALRRAFEQLGLDGVLCQEKTPVIYFRLVERIEPAEVATLRRLFWNQGVAPILVLVAPDQVHVYSSLTQPPSGAEDSQAEGFVEKLNRVADELQAFIFAVETGEYFHTHRQSFDPRQRVDRTLLRNLQAARVQLDQVSAARLEPDVLDALLCRLVFTCYLFDRKVIDREYLDDIGIREAGHLRDILGRKPRTEAKANLYQLFVQLGQDFNGDLFSDDLEAEARKVKTEHLDILNAFFRGTDPRTGQQAFWPYEFGIIPIETISAIYEHFSKAAGEQEKKEAGGFYTPRFLAELVLDQTLDGIPSLLGKRFLDPACGSGIFLVGLFNRLAEEWNRENPNAGYNAKLRGLTQILKTSLFGIDQNRTACLITAFSLYLALLDQLSPPDIRRVLRKVKVLPPLVAGHKGGAETIRRADFFTAEADLPQQVHFVVGNPPWAKVKSRTAPAALWCLARKIPFPSRQIATAFVRKAPDHLEPGGKVCFVLPHGTLFNHNPKAIAFQRDWLLQHAVELVLNLADYQRFLFEEAEVPAVVVRYAKEKPADSGHQIDYWAPKTSWGVTQVEVISVLPQDRSRLTVREVLDDLKGDDAPLIWKERYWATPRDIRLLDRLRLSPRLRDVIGKRASRVGKRWIIAEGFEPFGEKDPPASRRRLSLPRTARVEANTHELNLFLLRDECDIPQTLEIDVRRGISDLGIFKAPLVLVTEGFSKVPKVAFADFDIAYRHGIRGIRGPASDRELLAFLTVYLRSALARYFLFHTSASWGISRARVDVDDLMRLPFPLPEQTERPTQAQAAACVREVARILSDAVQQVSQTEFGRDQIAQRAQAQAEKFVEEYFDIDDIEKMLIADTDALIIPSARPARTRVDVPTIHAVKDDQRAAYTRLLCNRLNGWAKKEYQVHGKTAAESSIGVGMVVLEKTQRGENPSQIDGSTDSVLKAIDHLQRTAMKGHGTFELVRGLKVFDKNLLYITKPLGQRFWSNTAALNDADEIAATILTRSAQEGA